MLFIIFIGQVERLSRRLSTFASAPLLILPIEFCRSAPAATAAPSNPAHRTSGESRGICLQEVPARSRFAYCSRKRSGPSGPSTARPDQKLLPAFCPVRLL